MTKQDSTGFFPYSLEDGRFAPQLRASNEH